MIKEIKQYQQFKSSMDFLKNLILTDIQGNFPEVPVYFVIDNFLAWIVEKWIKENSVVQWKDISKRDNQIKDLFDRYTKWSRNHETFIPVLMRRHQSLNAIFSKENIMRMTEEQAITFFKSLNSTGMPRKRFQADKLFISENPIEKIRYSMNYFIYSSDNIEDKLTNMIKDPKYKLSQLGKSALMEIPGVINPHIYPLRNQKIDKALKVLGFNL